MTSDSPLNIDSELATVSTAIRDLAQNLLQTSQNVAKDPIIQVATESDVPWLQDFALPGPAHDMDQVIQEAFSIFHQRMRVNHPRFMGLIPSPTSPVAWLGDCIASAFNALGASKLQASGPVAVEKKLTEWLAAKIGFTGSRSGGIFVSGGSMANMMALVAARDCLVTPDQRSRAVTYLSDQTHYSVAKALRIIGFENHQIRRIPIGADFRMAIKSLNEQIDADRRAGLIPLVVVASCGTTNTGTVDDLDQIADTCQGQNVWLHVDGAYGASVALSSTRSHLVSGLARADSVSWDAHKWLFQTYSCGILLLKDTDNLRRSFANEGEYLRDGDAMLDNDIPNFWNYGMELTRPSHRAMKLWFTLRVLGLERIGAMIDHAFVLAETGENELKKLQGWDILSSSADNLAILTFRFCPEGLSEQEADDLNSSISKELIASNIAGILTTRIKGLVALRICALSPYLSTEEMVDIIKQTDQIARRRLQN